MKTILIAAVILLEFSVALRAETPLDREAVQQAVNKSIQWLEADMITWRNEHGCSACHHGPMYLWSLNAAKRTGYSVNDSQLREMTEWLLTSEKSRVFPKLTATELTQSDNPADRMTAAMMGHNNLSQPTLYLAHGLNAMPDDEPLKQVGWRKITEHFASAQMPDGSFVGRKGWPPIFNTPQLHTLFAVTALTLELNAPVPKASRHNPETTRQLERALSRANRFLDDQPSDETHQGLVLRLIRQSQIPRTRLSSSAPMSQLIDSLKSQQRRDGGWSQTLDRPSDAFATGQTLYALQMSGLTTSDHSVRRGLEFLTRTQQPDGTWPMTSRPNPETGNPADFLNPITYAATAWATLGLTSHVAR